MSDAPRDPQKPTCSCGHDRDHYMVSRDPEYTVSGSIWVAIFGVSTRPIRLKFRCRRCGEVFEETTDKAMLARYV